MKHPRTAVRHYCKALLEQQVSSVDNVFLSRPAKLNREELPCLLVWFGTETAEHVRGTENVPTRYKRNMTLHIDVVVEEIQTNNPLNVSQETEDLMDSIAWEVETAMMGDRKFANLLPDYDANRNYQGLLSNMNLNSTDVYDVSTESEVRMMAQRIQFSISYQSTNVLDKIFSDFESYLVNFRRAEETEVDDILTGAEGTL